MAQMVPDQAADFTTSGENIVYHFLAEAAKPDADYLCWYSPDIESAEPDFILYSPDCGLIVLEVKDWAIGQIIEMNPKTALLRLGAKEEWRKQPLAQAREYVNRIMSLFGKAGQSAAGNRALPCPVTWGAALPHISRQDWNANGFDKVADSKRILFWDELNPGSPLKARPENFRSWLKEHFPPLFQFSLNASQLKWIRQAIFPIAKIDLPKRGGCQAQADAVLAMDSAQENLAKNLGANRILINGCPGSGKTLVLATRAAWLPRVRPNIKKILIVCFNLSLAGYIRRLVAAKAGKYGTRGVEVLPFYNLCEKILGEPLEHNNTNADYYSYVEQLCLEKLAGSSNWRGYWDAIMVDEGQDFSRSMANVIKALMTAETGLTVAFDKNQELYHKDSGCWEDTKGIKLFKLDGQYRSTRQIARYAAEFMGLPLSRSLGAPGKKPEKLYCANSMAQTIAADIADQVYSGVAMSEIAAVYLTSGSGRNLPQELLHALEERGVMAHWLNQNLASKNLYDITTDSVTISTAHSVKGMDFSHVYLIGCDPAELAAPGPRLLAYVGMTRARERLVLCYSGK